MKKTTKKRPNGSLRVMHGIEGPGRVEQCHRDLVDINSIMAKVKRGHMVPIRTGSPLFGDFTNGTTFHDMNNRILDAQDQFMTLPAAIRQEFQNDPGQLMDFLNNPENLDEAIEMGLLEPSPADEPTPHESASEPKKEAHVSPPTVAKGQTSQLPT